MLRREHCIKMPCNVHTHYLQFFGLKTRQRLADIPNTIVEWYVLGKLDSITVQKSDDHSAKKVTMEMSVSPRGEEKTMGRHFQQANGHHWPARPSRNGQPSSMRLWPFHM